MKQCSYCGRENADDAAQCHECGMDEFVVPIAAPPVVEREQTVAESIKEPGRDSWIICPACGAVGNYRPAVAPGSSFNLLALLGGGILALLFFNAGRRRRVLCNKCEKGFYIRSPLSIAARVIFWLLVSPTLVVLGGWLIYLVVALFSN